MSSARTKAYLALILCELLWGASQPLVKPALEFITPSQFLFLRYLIAAPLLIPLVVRSIRQFHYTPRQWLKIIFIEAISVGNLFILYAGLTYVSALQSSFVLQTRPIFITLAGLLVLNESVERHEWLGFLLSLLGTFTILAKPFLLHPDGFTSSAFVGTGILILSNLVYTANIILIKRHYAHISKPAISGIHMWVGLIMFSLYLIPTGKLPDFNLIYTQPTILFPVLYMAIFGSIIALTLSNYSLSKIEASEATLFLYLQPLVYIPLSVLWLGETMDSSQLLGMTLIFLGVVSASRRTKPKFITHGFRKRQALRPLQLQN